MTWLDVVEILAYILGVAVAISGITIPLAFLMLAITDSRWFSRLKHWFFGLVDKIKNAKHKK